MKAVETTKTIWRTAFGLNPWDQPDTSPYPSPTPTCTLSEDQCDDLWGAYDSLASKYPSVSMTMPYCSEWQGWGSMIDPCDSCYVTANAVQLLYWPVTVKDQGACSNGTGTTITATPTIPGQPNTATWEDRTIVTSPSVYLSFSSLYAWGTKWYPSGIGYGLCGTTASNVMIPVKPEAITSYRGAAGWLAQEDPAHSNFPYPFNYADLNYRILNGSSSIPLVPKDAYRSMEDCYNGFNCSTIYPGGWYKPEIGLKAAVAAFTDVNPQWAKCGFEFGGFYDPPQPLTTQGSLVIPTPAHKPVPETTEPAPGQITLQPTETGGGDDSGFGGHGFGGGPKTPHLESTVAASDPTPEPELGGGASGSEPGNDGGSGGSSEGSGSNSGFGDPSSKGGSGNPGSDNGSGNSSSDSGSGDPGSNDGSSSSGSGSSGSKNGSGDPGLGDAGSSASGPGDHSGSANSGPNDPGSNNGGESSGSTAIITGSNGQSVTISQLPTPVGGNGAHGSQPQATAGPAFTVVGQGTTISIGGAAATVSGIEISAASGGIATRTAGTDSSGAGQGGWSTVSLTPAAHSDPAQQTGVVITLPHHPAPVTATELSPGVFVVPGSGDRSAVTISQGGSAATVDGVTISGASTGILLGGGGGRPATTVGVSGLPAMALAEATQAVITFPGQLMPITASKVASGVFVLPASGGKPAITISAGGSPATVDGVILSAGSAGIVIDGPNGEPTATIAASTAALATEAIFPVSGHGSVSAIEIRPGVFVIPGTAGGSDTTISAGGNAITVDGTVVSAESSGLVVAGETIPASTVAVPTGAESTGLGGYIISAIDSSSATAGTAKPTGGASPVKFERWRLAAIHFALFLAAMYL